MADDGGSFNWGALVQMGIAAMGEAKASQMSDKQLALIGQQLADLKGISLPDLQKMNPEQLGASAVGSMQSDQNLRGKQLAALSEIQRLADSGGLDLSDKAGLEEALNVARNQERRARAGVGARAAARGGMSNSARMMMDLDAASAGSNNLRQEGLQTAAMAQRRRLDAIKQASSMSGGLREQDWREKESSARARDLREERNAGARQRAAYYNAGLPQQQFNNQITKVTGQQTGVNNMANMYGNLAIDARASAAGLAGVVGAYDKVSRNGGAQQPTQATTYDQNLQDEIDNERGGDDG